MTPVSSNRDVAEAGGLPAGAKIGKYEIVERLGGGGQAIVYKAYDPFLDRHVAVKQVAPHLATEQRFVDRFRDVARSLARLQCEQIVTVHELIEEDGALFVVMEFVEGHTIESTLADAAEPIEVKAALQIMWRIAAGLAAIHKAGIIHRDIKPGNIIIGEGLRLKITDFGVAARAGTPVSMRLGTTKYMAPELFAGEKPVDGRADMYSLGIMAYEMLLGRGKFNEIFHDLVRDPHSEALRWMKWHSSPEQTAPPLAEVNPAIPAALSAIVAQMMAKDPADRMATMETLGREIRANFSPRAQRPAGRSGKSSRLSVSAAAEAEARAPAGAGMLAANGAESLAVTGPDEGPATAEVPRQPMPLRKKLAIAGTVALVLIVAGVVLLAERMSAMAEVRRKADGAYTAALKIYDEAGRAGTHADKQAGFAEALEAFRAVDKKYANQAAASRARVMGWLCNAHLAVLAAVAKQQKGQADAADWKAVGDHHERARDAVRTLQRTRGDLYEWTQQRERELDDFRDYWVRQEQYAKAIARAIAARDKGDLAQAKVILKDEARALALPGDQAEYVMALGQEIEARQRNRAFWSHIDAGDAEFKKSKWAQATRAYQDALKVLDASRSALDAKIAKEWKDTADAKIKAVTTEEAFAKAMASARKAERAKQRLAAAAAYESARKLKPAEAKTLNDKIRDLKHDHWLDQGRAKLAAKRMKEAKKFFLEARKFKPSAAVDAELAKIDQYDNFRSVVAQGQRLYYQKNYAEALKVYQQAGKLGSDPDLKVKMTECRYQMERGKAEVHRAKKEWSQAIQSLRRAKSIKPTEAARVDSLIQVVERERTYETHMAAAQKALAAKNFTAAVAALKQAKAVMAKPEVDTLIKDVRYAEGMAKGKQAFEADDFRSALAHFKLAKRQKSTPEVDTFIKQAEDAIKKQASSE